MRKQILRERSRRKAKKKKRQADRQEFKTCWSNRLIIGEDWTERKTKSRLIFTHIHQEIPLGSG
jgi:hypothetical protein